MKSHSPSSRTPLPPLSLALLAVYAVLAGAPAFAQTTTGTLKQVTVTGDAERETATSPVYGMVAKRTSTGLKTDTDLLETPQSVSVVTKEQIELQGASGLDQAIRYTSGATGGAYGDDPRSDWMLVRGFKPTLYLDGMALPEGSWTGYTRLEPYALERVEILKGPASATYGAVPPSGFINAVSKRPQAEAQREIGFEYGTDAKKQLTFDLTGPLTADSQWLYRLVGLARNGDAAIDFAKDDRYTLAPSLTWKPSSDTTLTLLGLFQKSKTTGVPGFLPAEGTLLPNPNGQISRSFNAGEPGYDKYDKDTQSLGYLLAHRFNDQYTFRQNLRVVNSEVENPAVVGAGLATGSDRILNRYVYTPHNRTKMFTIDNQLETTFDTGAAKHTLLAGLDYKQTRDDNAYGFAFGVDSIDIYNPVYGGAVVTPADSSHTLLKQKQLGLYLQDQIRWDRWVATLSGRHDNVDSDNTNVIAGTTASQTDRKWSGRAGLNYVMPNGLAPYVAYATSFQPTTERGFTGNAFQPTTGKQWEAGVKYRPTDGNSLFTAAVFDLKQQNVSTPDPDPTHLFFSVQQGEVHSRGLELEAKFNATRGLDVITTYSYIDAKTTRSNTAADVDKQIPLQPKQQATVWMDYRFPGDVVPGLGVGGGVRYTGASYGDSANVWKAPAYTLFDLQANYTVQNWRFLLTVNNVADKKYVANCYSGSSCFYGYGRTASISAKYIW